MIATPPTMRYTCPHCHHAFAELHELRAHFRQHHNCRQVAHYEMAIHGLSERV